MSIRVDSSPLITGAVVVGDPGLGVLAEAVPSTGEHGAGYLYDSLEFPADSGKEVRGLITTWPTLGTLTAFEDSSFEYDGPTDSFAFQMYVDGVAVGTPQTVTVTVGATTSVSSDVTAAYTLRASVSADAIAAYAIENTGQVSASISSAYAIRGQVSADAPADYAVRGSLSADSVSAYDIRGQVQQDVLASYVIRSAVFADTSAAYVLRGLVSVDGTFSYRVLGDFGDFPDPATVLLGTVYGPGGSYVGTLPPGGDIAAIAAAVWAAAPALTVGKFLALK